MSAWPEIRLNACRVVYNDGNHNAFTDLCRFRDHYYLTFRSCPDGHMVFPTSRILILRSRDGGEWQPVHAFGVAGRDVRDPHFLIFRERLWVYSGTWRYHPERPDYRDVNEHLGYAVWSDDGVHWQGPRLLEGTYGHYVWRAAAWDGRAYLCARRRRDFASSDGAEEPGAAMQAALLGSDDGLIWHFVGWFQEMYGDETAFLFEPDGAILAIARGPRTRPVATLCRSRPPYQQWQRTPLERNVGGPLLARWGQCYLVGGRKTVDPSAPRTTLYWLADDRLVEALELPSGGDNSYPGFVALDETRGLLSYYSSHEGSGSSLAPSAIYLAELSLGGDERARDCEAR